MMPSIQMLGIDLDALKGAVVVWAGDMDPSPFGNHGKGELTGCYECRYPQYDGERNLQQELTLTRRELRARKRRADQRVIWRASGKCSRCGAEKDEDHAMCPSCRRSRREYKRLVNGCQGRI